MTPNDKLNDQTQAVLDDLADLGDTCSQLLNNALVREPNVVQVENPATLQPQAPQLRTITWYEEEYVAYHRCD